MSQSRTVVLLILVLVAGFAGGFVLRPIIAPPPPTLSATYSPPLAVEVVDARGRQYFETHIDEAHRVTADCRTSAARGAECAKAEQAITQVEGRNRLKKFLGH